MHKKTKPCSSRVRTARQFTTRKVPAYLCIALALLQLLLTVFSWVLTALYPELPMRSLLSGDGLRWLFGTSVSNVRTDVLVWLLLAGMAYGCVERSRLPLSAASFRRLSGYERMAVFVVLWEITAIVAAVIVLTFVPHAALLGVQGDIFPSSFSAGAVPLAALSAICVSATYGSLTGAWRGVDGFFSSMLYGMCRIAPLVIVYMAASEFCSSLVWVLCL